MHTWHAIYVFLQKLKLDNSFNPSGTRVCQGIHLTFESDMSRLKSFWADPLDARSMRDARASIYLQKKTHRRWFLKCQMDAVASLFRWAPKTVRVFRFTWKHNILWAKTRRIFPTDGLYKFDSSIEKIAFFQHEVNIFSHRNFDPKIRGMPWHPSFYFSDFFHLPLKSMKHALASISRDALASIPGNRARGMPWHPSTEQKTSHLVKCGSDQIFREIVWCFL